MFEFRNLEVYKKAKVFYNRAMILVNQKTFNRHVNDQLSRASFSVVLNIAEGSGRATNPDRKRFFVISRSSVFECVAILDVMHDEGLVTNNQFEEMHERADELSRMLFVMTRNLS